MDAQNCSVASHTIQRTGWTETSHPYARPAALVRRTASHKEPTTHDAAAIQDSTVGIVSAHETGLLSQSSLFSFSDAMQSYDVVWLERARFTTALPPFFFFRSAPP